MPDFVRIDSSSVVVDPADVERFWARTKHIIMTVKGLVMTLKCKDFHLTVHTSSCFTIYIDNTTAKWQSTMAAWLYELVCMHLISGKLMYRHHRMDNFA